MNIIDRLFTRRATGRQGRPCLPPAHAALARLDTPSCLSVPTSTDELIISADRVHPIAVVVAADQTTSDFVTSNTECRMDILSRPNQAESNAPRRIVGTTANPPQPGSSSDGSRLAPAGPLTMPA